MAQQRERRDLDESDSVVLDGSGGGTVRLRPDGSHEWWFPSSAHNKVTGAATNPPDAKCYVYVGPVVADRYFVDATASGSFGDSTDRVAGRIIARTRDPYIFGVFIGGEPGATATFTVVGEKEIRI